MEEKETPQVPTDGKTKLKTDNIVATFRLMTTRPNPQANKEGFRLSALETDDLYKAIRAINALKPVAKAFDEFEQDAQERLKPQGWDEKVEKFSSMTDDEKAELNKLGLDYNTKVNECVTAELHKEREIDAIEHLSQAGFCALVKDNSHLLDSTSTLMLQEIIG